MLCRREKQKFKFMKKRFIIYKYKAKTIWECAKGKAKSAYKYKP